MTAPVSDPLLPLVLAIDTALENCSVALSVGDRVLARVKTIGRGHAEVLMGEIAALMQEAGVAPASLTRIAVSVGPGSFTGLRVGIAAARGLALVGRIPVVGVSTLAIHAERALLLSRRARPVLALLPARADELFGAAYFPDGTLLDLPSARPAAAFADEAIVKGYDVAGAGARLLGPSFVPLHDESAPDIATLLALGARLDPETHPPKPLYVKPPDAAPQAGARIARR